MSFYPDNDNREARLKQLISQTSTIQSLFVTTENNIKQANNDAADMVKKLSQRAGYATVQQYCEAGLRALTPAQKAHYKQMTDALVKHNEPLKNTQLAFGALGALGTFLKIGVPKIVAVFCKFGAFVIGMQGILRGLVKMFKGAFEDGWAIIRVFSTMIRGNYSRAIHVGEDITETMSKSLKWVGRAGKVLQWAGILAEVGIMIASAVEGAKQKEGLQKAIIEACCTRFGVKKIQLLMNQTMMWNSKVTGIINNVHFLQKKMDQQKVKPPAKPSMLITQEDIDQQIADDLDEILGTFDAELRDCNTDTKVMGELALLDDSSSSGERAWTNEDPNLEKIKQWLEEHPMKDNEGNIIAIDGASFEDVGLKWPTKEIVSANKDDTTVTITGTNDTKKGQRFSSIHLSFPVGPDAETALFTSTKFAKKGGMTVGDVVFDIVADEGVTGVGKNITSRYKSEDGCIKIQILPAPGCDTITLPPQKAIKFVFTGKTGEVGISSCLVREEWYPPTPDAKKFYDVMVEKQ